MDRPLYAAELRDMRQRANLSQSELASELGVSSRAVVFVEGGRRCPSVSLLEKWLSRCGEGTRLDIVADLVVHFPRSAVAAELGRTCGVDRRRVLVSRTVDTVLHIMRDESGHVCAMPISSAGVERIRAALFALVDDLLARNNPGETDAAA